MGLECSLSSGWGLHQVVLGDQSVTPIVSVYPLCPASCARKHKQPPPKYGPGSSQPACQGPRPSSQQEGPSSLGWTPGSGLPTSASNRSLPRKGFWLGNLPVPRVLSLGHKPQPDLVSPLSTQFHVDLSFFQPSLYSSFWQSPASFLGQLFHI